MFAPAAFRNFIQHLYARTPFDGKGLCSGPDTLAHLRRWATKKFWRRLPWWLRPFGRLAARSIWAAVAFQRTSKFVWRQRSWRRQYPVLLWDCLCSGARPNEALVWRFCFNTTGPHPLPGRAAGILLSKLGDPASHKLLGDKLATAELLSRAGIPTPPVLAVLSRNAIASPRSWGGPGPFFLKPRHGSASNWTQSVESPDMYPCGLDQGMSTNTDTIMDWLRRATEQDDILVQNRLISCPTLIEFTTTDSPPVLRLTTAREPRREAFLHSALLAVNVPGEDPRHFTRGQLRIPIDLTKGQMQSAIWFALQRERFSRLPWNAAPILGRPLARFDAACDIVLKAADLLPELALINWDLILTPEGPTILEGNTCGNWILTNLSALDGLTTIPLAPLLWKWT